MVKRINQYNTFDFNFERIMDFCNKLKNLEDQIIYLKWILIELEHEKEDIPLILKAGYKAYLRDIEEQEKNLAEDECYLPISWGDYKDFFSLIGEEIKYREKLVELFKSRKSQKETDIQEEEVVAESLNHSNDKSKVPEKNGEKAISGMDKLLNIQEASSLIGLATGTIYKLISARKIPHKKIGGKVLFSPLELQKWLKKKSVKPISE